MSYKLRYNLNGPAMVGDRLQFNRGDVREIPESLAIEVQQNEASWRAKGFELILPDQVQAGGDADG